MLEVSTRERDDVVIADLRGRLTMGVGDKVLHEAVDDMLATGWRQIVLNMADVEYIDSSGVGELVGALRVTKAMSGSLKLLCTRGHVYDTLSVARLLPLFEVFASEDEAVASFAGQVSTTKPEVLCDVEDGVACVRLDRPRRLNALTRTMLADLVSVISGIRRDEDIRAMVLTGNGRAFCYGADAEELREGRGALPTLEIFQTVIRDLVSLPKPVIGAINGFATGAGLDLALACDLRVMSKRAKLSSAFLSFGLVPDGGSTQILPRLIGHARAAELVLTGRAVGAEEAERWGLVNRIAPPDKVMEEAMGWARELAAGPRRAIGRAKKLLRKNMSGPLEDALAAEAAEQADAFGDDEFLEGLKAHFEKRQPSFPR